MSTKTQKEELKVWNHKIKTEEEKEVTVKDVDLKVVFYKTTEGLEGIRVPLFDNGQLMQVFADYSDTLQDKLSEREKKYSLIQFSTFGEHDKGLDFLQMIGFYRLGDHIIFHTEPDSPKPLERLAKFVEYYKAKFNIQTKPKKDLFNQLGVLDLSD
jgi:hypothetical protein